MLIFHIVFNQMYVVDILQWTLFAYNQMLQKPSKYCLYVWKHERLLQLK